MGQHWLFSLCCHYLSVSSAKWLTSGGTGLFWGNRISSQAEDLNVVQRRTRAKWNSLSTSVSVHHSISLLRPSEIMTSISSCFLNLMKVPLWASLTQNHTRKETVGNIVPRLTNLLMEHCSMASKGGFPGLLGVWKPFHRKNSLMELKIIILGWREDSKVACHKY